MKRRNFLSGIVACLCAPLGALGLGRKAKASPCLLPSGMKIERLTLSNNKDDVAWLEQRRFVCLIWTGDGDGKSFNDPANWRQS